jgi:hypothetical protein
VCLVRRAIWVEYVEVCPKEEPKDDAVRDAGVLAEETGEREPEGGCDGRVELGASSCGGAQARSRIK